VQFLLNLQNIDYLLITVFDWMDLKNFWHVDGCPVTQPQQLINLFRSLILIASRKVALSI